MACLLNGLDGEETLAMTRAMVASGDTLAFSDLGAPAVDKHSTGGVADGRSWSRRLAAALGLAVAKLSGRGAGAHRRHPGQARVHPGAADGLSPDEIRRQVDSVAAPWRRSRPPSCRPTARSTRPRRDRHGAVGPADRGQRDVEEACGDHDLILLDVKAGSAPS